jgi:hypothetical protein
MMAIRQAILLAAVAVGLCACAMHMSGVRIEGEGLYTARSFLIGARPELPDYGLYSYLLFSKPPTTESRGRYAAALRAYLAHPPAPSWEELLPHGNLNIFYLLLEDTPPEAIARCLRHTCDPVEDAIIEWILNHYNYARAQIILKRVSRANKPGPCIVTTTAPLPLPMAATLARPSAPPSGGEAAPMVLVQDMSNTPAHLVRDWMNLFIEKATGEGSAHQQNLQALLLHLRTALDGYAKGLPEVFKACLECLRLKRKLERTSRPLRGMRLSRRQGDDGHLDLGAPFPRGQPPSAAGLGIGIPFEGGAQLAQRIVVVTPGGVGIVCQEGGWDCLGVFTNGG